MEIEDIINEWSYRLPKGYPTMEDGKFTDPSELKVLHEILKENGINEMPSFVKSKTPVSDVVLREEPSPLLEDDLFEDEDLETLDTPSLPDSAKEPDTEYKNTASAEEVQKKFEEAMKAAEVLGPKTLGKMYNRLAAFSLYMPIKNALDGSGYTKVKDKNGKVKYDMPEKIANELQMKLEDLNTSGYKGFIDFINTPKKDKPEFPGQKNGEGNLITDLGDQSVAEEILRKVAEHSTQDQSNLGVGMGEFLMAMSFSNIWNPAGAGDLALGTSQENAKLLEVKGYSARLAGVGNNLTKDKNILKRYEDLNIPALAGTSGSKGKYGYATMSEALIAIYNKSDSEKQGKIIQLVNDTCKQGNTDMISNATKSLQVDSADFQSPIALSNKLGAIGVYAYMTQHRQFAFIALDYGKGGGGNVGNYLYGTGGPEAAATYFASYKGNVIFEPWRLNLTRPRIEYKK
tara:strand:+ start:2388 stop:3764 length:1377 start_codon:yes stop_codon:yes gene_type:complete